MLKSATFILKIAAVYNVDFLTSVVILFELKRLHCLWNFFIIIIIIIIIII